MMFPGDRMATKTNQQHDQKTIDQVLAAIREEPSGSDDANGDRHGSREPSGSGTTEQDQRLEAEVRRHFVDIDHHGGGHECLDGEQVGQLMKLLGIDLDSTTFSVITAMTEMLNPDGTKALHAHDMLVDFDEFFQWYVKKHITKFTLRVENNPALFSASDVVCTIQVKNLSDLKKAVKHAIGVDGSIDVDVYYYDEQFESQTQPRSLADLQNASKGICPEGGYKLPIYVVDARVGLHRECG